MTNNILFIGHGSPMNAINKNRYTSDLQKYSSLLATPRAAVIISAHWLTRGTYITGAENPEQIYDFYGFPDELYNVKYTPPGSPETAEIISRKCNFIRIDPNRGIDHAAWAVVKHMFPDCNVPLLEISLDLRMTPQEHFNAGREMRMLKEEGILFIGSGNIVHNLSIIDFDDNAVPYEWAVSTDSALKRMIDSHDTESLINYKETLKNYKFAIPTEEHYLPLLYIMGMAADGEKPVYFHESVQNGSISMRSFELKI